MLEELNANDFHVLLLGFDDSGAQQIEQSVANTTHPIHFKSIHSAKMESVDEASVLIYRLGSAIDTSQIQLLKSYSQSHPSTSILTYGAVEQLPTFLELTDQVDIYSFIENVSDLEQSLLKAFEYHQNKKTHFDSLGKVRRQNKILESMKENLEELVYERTKKEFESSKEMEASVKHIQSLLNFITNVSRQDNIEDLMNQIRGEFKKIHGLMPPMLILEVMGGLRLFFFQGKQLIEKRVTHQDFAHFSDLESIEMKQQLSHFLGRPFGKLTVLELSFHAEELSGIYGSMIFEHSLGGEGRENYEEFSKQRWPVINMAFESLLLKEGLQNIAKQWASTFNEMKDPILIVSEDHRMSLTNSGLHKKGYSTCYQAFAQREEPCSDCPISKTFVTEEPQTSDIRVDEKIYRVHSYPIRLQGYEGSSHVINQYVDVTKSIDLQSRVIQGEKMAAVGLLAGNIAHELNNPLTGIHSLSDLLLQELEAETNLFKDLTEVKHAARRCQRIIKDLLDFTEVGGDSRVHAIDVNQLITKTLPLLKMAMRTLNADVQLWESPLLVYVNPQLLQQVLFNLINNACQAMGESGYLYVTSQLCENHVEVRVRDTGPGIPQSIADSIFDPFFTTKAEGEGTGLGLSMSKSVVERAGGQLALNRDLDEGTEFIVRLPVVAE